MTDTIQACGCGTRDQALVWCYVHGYLIKPPALFRKGRPVKAEPAVPRRCGLRSKCLRAFNRQAAIIEGKGFGNGQYCSKICAQSAKAIEKRSAMSPTPCQPQPVHELPLGAA